MLCRGMPVHGRARSLSAQLTRARSDFACSEREGCDRAGITHGVARQQQALLGQIERTRRRGVAGDADEVELSPAVTKDHAVGVREGRIETHFHRKLLGDHIADLLKLQLDLSPELARPGDFRRAVCSQREPVRDRFLLLGQAFGQQGHQSAAVLSIKSRSFSVAMIRVPRGMHCTERLVP